MRSEGASGTVTTSFTPSKERALLILPDIQTGPPINVPVLPFPEASEAIVPEVSSSLHQAMGGGGTTVNIKLVVLTTAPAVPVTTTVYVPTGVEAVVAMVMVEEQVGLQEVGTNEAVAPVGRPEAVKETD